MRNVKFVRSLNVEIAQVMSDTELRYHDFKMTRMASNGASLRFADEEVKEHVVPIHQFCRVTQEARHPGEAPEIETTYLAYSKEVEELLELPFLALRNEVRDAHHGRIRAERQAEDLHSLNSMMTEVVEEASFWKRLKFLFGGKLG